MFLKNTAIRCDSELLKHNLTLCYLSELAVTSCILALSCRRNGMLWVLVRWNLGVRLGCTAQPTATLTPKKTSRMKVNWAINISPQPCTR